MSSNFCLCSDCELGLSLWCLSFSLENRRDNIKLRQLSIKIKDLIAGDYSEVVDMQEADRYDQQYQWSICRLTHGSNEQETRKRLTSILAYMTDGTTNGRGSDRHGEMALTIEYPDEVLNTSILICSLGSDATCVACCNARVNHRFPRWKWYLNFITAVRRESGFISGL